MGTTVLGNVGSNKELYSWSEKRRKKEEETRWRNQRKEKNVII